MLLDIAQPVSLLLCILSLYSVFHASFLVPSSSFEERIHHGLLRLAVAAAIAMLSGLLFSESAPHTARPVRWLTLLPIQIFCWATTAITLLFAVSWYLETFVVLYRDTRRF